MAELQDIYATTDEFLDQGVYAIGIVDKPAIEEGFVAMSIEKHQIHLSSDEKQILTGPVLIPEQRILRKTAEGEPYNLVWSAETIEQNRNIFAKQLMSNFSLTHQHQSGIGGAAYVVESWITQDTEKDKAATMGFDLPAGTWMMSVRVVDKDYWDSQVKQGKVTGFSIEAFVEPPKLDSMEDKKPKEEKQSLLQRIAQGVEALLKSKSSSTPIHQMEVYIPIEDGERIMVVFPDDGSPIEVQDAEGNILGTITFEPANADSGEEQKKDKKEEEQNSENAEQKKDKKEEEQNSENAEQSAIVELTKAVTALAEENKSIKAMLSKANKPSEDVPDKTKAEDGKQQSLSLAKQFLNID